MRNSSDNLLEALFKLYFLVPSTKKEREEGGGENKSD